MKATNTKDVKVFEWIVIVIVFGHCCHIIAGAAHAIDHLRRTAGGTILSSALLT